MVSFLVSDSGPGVPNDLRKKLFEIGISTKEGGWGVGLSLTRRIITIMHDGNISLDQRAEGACFRVELPEDPGSEHADPA
jgi:nitrogen-specific signal transduction histidine kinase